MFKKIVSFLCIILFIAMSEAQANPLPVISKLQKQRLQVCESVRDENFKNLTKHLKATQKFLEKEERKSDDPKKMNQLFSPAYKKIEKVIQVHAYDRVADVLTFQIYRDALIGLREKYREEIKQERLKPYETYVDFFINDCNELV